jgi:uncharacterized protein YcgL (UPF0745 family)
MSSYIRAKRDKQTVFLYIDSNDTISKVQEKLGKIVNKNGSEIRLYSGGQALDGSKSVSDARLENDAVVNFVFSTGNGWEDVKA